MTPRIEIINEKKFIGKELTMSLADDKTFKLFSDFMPRRKEILNVVSTDIFDLQVYPSHYYSNFNPTNIFTKWALLEVSDFVNIPNNMKSFILKSGLYAVFDYKGLSTDKRVFNYIYETWLPNSCYFVNTRPHFEILGEKYKNNDPNSEEEIWIPVKLKS